MTNEPGPVWQRQRPAGSDVEGSSGTL